MKKIYLLLFAIGGWCLGSGFLMETNSAIHQIYRDMQYIEAILWFVLAVLVYMVVDKAEEKEEEKEVKIKWGFQPDEHVNCRCNPTEVKEEMVKGMEGAVKRGPSSGIVSKTVDRVTKGSGYTEEELK